MSRRGYEAALTSFNPRSYGFRPGRNPHQALSALHTAIMSQRVNWVLDADIRSFFDSVDHELLLRMLAHRIADPRILRLVRKWLEAGILEGSDRAPCLSCGISARDCGPAWPSLSLRFGSESPTWLVSVAVIRENRGIDMGQGGKQC